MRTFFVSLLACLFGLFALGCGRTPEPAPKPDPAPIVQPEPEPKSPPDAKPKPTVAAPLAVAEEYLRVFASFPGGF